MNSNYAGAFNVFVSACDAKIQFLEVNPQVIADGQIVDERVPVCNITMSLPLAKQLAKHLTEAIVNYETSIGGILDLDELQNKVDGSAV